MMRFKAMILASCLIPLAAGIAQAQDTTGKTLDLCGLRPTFTEDFNDLKVSAWKIMGDSRWIAHTPWAGDFGDAAFTDPKPDFPFTVKDGVSRIEARKENGEWRSGLLASADAWNGGFAQMYGYFEARIKLPKGPGTWPAFWFSESWPRGSPPGVTVEIDLLEYYGKFPDGFHSVVHLWGANHPGSDYIKLVPTGSLDDDFHTYGFEVEKDFMTFYFDRNQYWQVPTPEEHKHPFMILVNLALGSGWPIDETPNPSFMDVDYVHAYERDPAACVKEQSGKL